MKQYYIHQYTCIHTQNSARELKKEAQNARINLKTIESLTYECSDSVVLKELNKKLKQVLLKLFMSVRRGVVLSLTTGNAFNQYSQVIFTL